MSQLNVAMFFSGLRFLDECESKPESGFNKIMMMVVVYDLIWWRMLDFCYVLLSRLVEF